MNLSNKLYIFVIIDIVLIALIVFILNQKVLPDTETNSYKYINTITSYNGTFEITAPNDWKLPEERGKLNLAADIELIDNTNSYFLIAMMQNKQDVNLSYNEFKNASLKLVEDTYNVKIDNTNTLNINNFDIYYSTFSAKIDNSDIYMHIYFLETENYYGKLLLWGNSENSKILDNIANDMIKTFKEI